MKVVGINGQHEVNDIHELESILMRRCDGRVNSFWLSHDGQDYPSLGFVVNGDLASLTYCPYEFHPGFKSVRNVADKMEAGETSFPISSTDDVIVDNGFVLPFAAALVAAMEFFNCKGLPRSVEWFEL